MNESKLRHRWVIVEQGSDFIQTRGIFSNFARAVGEAYLIAKEYADDWSDNPSERGTISQMFDLEMETGVMFAVSRGTETARRYYVLEHEGEDDEEC